MAFPTFVSPPRFKKPENITAKRLCSGDIFFNCGLFLNSSVALIFSLSNVFPIVKSGVAESCNDLRSQAEVIKPFHLAKPVYPKAILASKQKITPHLFDSSSTNRPLLDKRRSDNLNSVFFV